MAVPDLAIKIGWPVELSVNLSDAHHDSRLLHSARIVACFRRAGDSATTSPREVLEIDDDFESGMSV